MKTFIAAAMTALALASNAVFAQGYKATDKDGGTVYSNKPLENLTGKPAPLSLPAGADTTSYQLGGASLEDVQKDAAQKGPLDPATGSRAWSATTWGAAWNYWTRQEAEACRIDVVSVRLKIATQLPEWREPKEVAAVDHCRWSALVGSLRKKESARVEQALARGRELERAILALPARPRCDGYAAEIAALGQKLIDDGRPHAQAVPAAPALTLAKPLSKAPAKPAPPAPPKPLPIPKAIFDACPA